MRCIGVQWMLPIKNAIYYQKVFFSDTNGAGTNSNQPAYFKRPLNKYLGAAKTIVTLSHQAQTTIDESNDRLIMQEDQQA